MAISNQSEIPTGERSLSVTEGSRSGKVPDQLAKDVILQENAQLSPSAQRDLHDEFASCCVAFQPSTFDYSSTAMELVKSFAAGSLSASFSSVLLQPLDLVKTRLQLGDSNSGKSFTRRRGLLKCMTYIARTESVRGLWRGTAATIVRSVPGVGLYFSMLHTLKTISGIEKPTPYQALVLGFSSRCLAGAALMPATVIKTRFESGRYPYRSMVHAAHSIYVLEGFRGLYSGLLPTLARDAPYSGLYLLFYTEFKGVTYAHLVISKTELRDAINFTCGVMAGLAAAFVTQPADLLKTRMQSDPVKFPSVSSTVLHVYRTEGLQGYFRGLAPRLLRRTLMSALAWTFYERLSQRLIHTRSVSTS
ncbi:solute carrier family 25 member 38-like [Tropilaelaps mercedesae]|uniref:Mitochondrial glycine transporter n=1 Tax=Tropilaelaps mercedesae TaxID=418985 RepID=A0A1V9XDJ3_9ACAR|nr:solute carrier family 25 member 38-like [Tropilaelaps mercedesae]